jgi:hypothetical protein
MLEYVESVIDGGAQQTEAVAGVRYQGRERTQPCSAVQRAAY